jgi:hypothetical protein
MEYTTPAMFLPLRGLVPSSCTRHDYFPFLGPYGGFLCHMTRKVVSRIHCGGYGHAHIIQIDFLLHAFVLS